MKEEGLSILVSRVPAIIFIEEDTMNTTFEASVALAALLATTALL